MKKFLYVLTIFCAICLYSAEITGKVIKIYDGDTIRVEDSDGGKFRVRFSDIDTPEKAQPCSAEAAAFLRELIEGKTLKIKFREIDTYGRIVGTVYIDDISVNQMLVGAGWAWWYRDYSKNKEIEKLEAEARKNKLGLWKEENPVPPWQFRKEQKEKKGGE